jgi:surfeit locus 1 family protein
MRPLPSRVQPRWRWLPTLAALVVVVATALLGRWQLHRAQEKAALQAVLEARVLAPALDLAALASQPLDPDPEALRFRRAHAQGRYLAQGQIYIDNRDQDGVPGYHVLTPLRLGARVLLVNRGFLARDASYPRPPRVAVPDGEIGVSGQLSMARSRFFELSADTVNGPVWQNLKFDQYRAASGLAVMPLVLLADPAAPGLLAVHEQPDANISMHRGYAFQWFALCATTVVLFLYFTLLRRKSGPR